MANPNPREFQPFGTGPRSCIGRAAGVLQLRILAWELARSYEVVGGTEGKSFKEVPASLDKLKL